MSLRKRKEIQEVLRRLSAAALLLIPAAMSSHAAIWPEEWSGYKRLGSKAVEAPDPALSGEYGLVEAEQADYSGQGRKLSGTAYRLKDSTGAYAFFQWQRPAGARASKLSEVAAETSGSAWVAVGNYVLAFEGRKPRTAELTALAGLLPDLRRTPFPNLARYLPGGLVSNSERYVLGPKSLQSFAPSVPASVADFDLGVEAQVASVRGPEGTVPMAVFSYPTPQLARVKAPQFDQIPGTTVKRTGPLVAVVFEGSAAAANKILDPVNYRASIMMNEPTKEIIENPGDMLIAIFQMIGYVLIFCIAAGLAYAGIRRLKRRIFGGSETGEPMIVLGLRDE